MRNDVTNERKCIIRRTILRFNCWNAAEDFQIYYDSEIKYCLTELKEKKNKSVTETDVKSPSNEYRSVLRVIDSEGLFSTDSSLGKCCSSFRRGLRENEDEEGTQIAASRRKARGRNETVSSDCFWPSDWLERNDDHRSERTSFMATTNVWSARFSFDERNSVKYWFESIDDGNCSSMTRNRVENDDSDRIRRIVDVSIEQLELKLMTMISDWNERHSDHWFDSIWCD